MNSGQGSTSAVKKQEDTGEDKNEKREAKPVVKTLNRVPRACNACRKQKMRCEGADNPPCRRCRNTGLECLFEKPSREATLTGEAGLERIRSLENHVADIRHTQNSILNVLADISAQLRAGSGHTRSPPAFPPFHPSPTVIHSPAVSTPPTAHPHAPEVQQPAGPSNVYGHPSDPRLPPQRPGIGQHQLSHPSQVSPIESYQSSQGTSVQGNAYPANYNGNTYHSHHQQQQQGGQSHVLPPFSSLPSMGPHQQGNVSSKRPAPGSSNVTSAASSDVEDEDDGELPALGLVAPWEVLRGLADVASERAAKEVENGSRPRTPTPEHGRPTKRRKLRHKTRTFPDVVTKNIISVQEAHALFQVFYHGCSTFLPVFDSNVDTFEALHERSPFAVNCICMVAARVRDGGGPSSEIYKKCLEEAQSISCATLFLPVTRVEAIQAMILVSGWSDNGWLTGGHAVRMAMEMSLHKAWPRLKRRMKANKSSTDDRELVIASRTWFCLYLFEHQMSYGTGRPAIMKDDDTIQECRLLLRHPLAIEDDMRLVSTVELMCIRERVHNVLAPFDEAVKDTDFEELKKADNEFQSWYTTWDHAFSQKYEDVAFYRQSLQIQQLHAELFHNATALRGINGPKDVEKMPAVQRDLALRSIYIAKQGLDITVNSPAYREGLKYAVQYTHVAATFAASFLLRLSRLFPEQCDVYEVKSQVERLATIMADLPGKRYALTIELMLKGFQQRSNSRSPKTTREQARPQPPRLENPGSTVMRQNSGPVPFSPAYETFPQGPHDAMRQHHPQQQQQQLSPHAQMPQQHLHHNVHHQPHRHVAYPLQQGQHTYPAEAEHIWNGFEGAAGDTLPVWISDQTLGGTTFSQQGMDAFVLPPEYLPNTHQMPAPQIF